MNNFNLKNLVIAVILFSALMIIGALVTNFINVRSQKPPVTIQTTNNAQPAVSVVGGIGVQPGKAQKATQPELIK